MLSAVILFSISNYVLNVHGWHSDRLKVYVDNIGIKHGFSCFNIRQVPWEVLKTYADGRGFQHFPRDLANVNALKKHIWSLLLHKNWKHLLHFALYLALFCLANAISTDFAHSRTRQYTSRDGFKSVARVRAYWMLRSRALTARELPCYTRLFAG